MNRVSLLLQKSYFNTRQRHAINFTHKFMISDKDVRRAAANDGQEPPGNEQFVAKVLDGFDPKQNVQDRRTLFEVTGMRLIKGEFQNEDDSSDSEGDEEELLPIDYAIMERFEDEEEGEEGPSQTYSLND